MFVGNFALFDEIKSFDRSHKWGTMHDLDAIRSIKLRISALERRLGELCRGDSDVLTRLQLLKQKYRVWLEKNPNVASALHQLAKLDGILEKEVASTDSASSSETKALLIQISAEELMVNLEHLNAIKQSLHIIDEAVPALQAAQRHAKDVYDGLEAQIEQKRYLDKLERQIYSLALLHYKSVNRFNVLYVSAFEELQSFEKCVNQKLLQPEYDRMET